MDIKEVATDRSETVELPKTVELFIPLHRIRKGEWVPGHA